jgi:hypothetical protein
MQNAPKEIELRLVNASVTILETLTWSANQSVLSIMSALTPWLASVNTVGILAREFAELMLHVLLPVTYHYANVTLDIQETHLYLAKE